MTDAHKQKVLIAQDYSLLRQKDSKQRDSASMRSSRRSEPNPADVHYLTAITTRRDRFQTLESEKTTPKTKTKTKLHPHLSAEVANYQPKSAKLYQTG